MLRKICLLLAIWQPLLSSAQINISSQLPAGGMVQKEQLWNLVLANGKEESVAITIKMSLHDLSTGQVLLSAQSGDFYLPKGIKALSANDVQPILYNFNSPDYSRTYLPLGNYLVCYQVTETGIKADPLAQECINVNIDPLSPPLLNTPGDQTEIQTAYPQFTWMPPTPFDMFSNLNYDLIVTEVLPNQAPSDAIQQNIPVYSRNNLSQPSENYATSFGALIPDKVYAWQVVARNGLSYAAKTEVWTFRLSKENQPSEKATTSYFLLQDDITAVYHVKEPLLRIKYYSFDKEFISTVKFSDTRGSVVKEVKQKITPGNNYLEFEVKRNFQKGQLYTLSIADIHKKIHLLTFSID